MEDDQGRHIDYFLDVAGHLQEVWSDQTFNRHVNSYSENSFSMKIEPFQTLRELSETNADLAVPGLSGENLSGCLLWLEASDRGDVLANIVSNVSRSFLKDYYSDISCWVGSVVQFPQHVALFAKAGWLSSDDQVSDAINKNQVLLVWQRIPDPRADIWDAFWNVPLNPTLTNVVCIKNETKVVMLRESAEAIPRRFSTLLPWPGTKNQGDQEACFRNFEGGIKLLILGILDCNLGLQVITPLENRDNLERQLLTYRVKKI